MPSAAVVAARTDRYRQSAYPTAALPITDKATIGQARRSG